MRGRTLFVLFLAFAFGHSALTARAQSAETVTLEGQVTCSQCWFEADRTTTPYGGEADTKCAIMCAKGGIPGALAVTKDGTTTLYILESGKYDLGEHGKNWTDHTGHMARITGTLRVEGDKRIVRVDALEVLPTSS